MMHDPKVRVGKTVSGGKPLTAFEGLSALNEIVAAARECVVLSQTESTKRARVNAYEHTEVARINAAEAVLKSYFEQVFAERQSNFDALFTRLDDAIDARNGEQVNLVLRSIVDIAKTSPLADLGDLSQIRTALDDPDQVWDL